MAQLIDRLTKEIPECSPPKWLSSNTIYVTLMGSVTYGCSTDTSDKDVYGCCIPPKDIIFPWTAGLIPGFDSSPGFDQWQQHHLKSGDGNEYDFTIFGIIKYFKLLIKNNPNMIDSLFTREEHVLHCSKSFEIVRERRKEFLHKGAWHSFKGYAFSQLHKMNNKSPRPGSKRYDTIMKYGYDVKFAYHIVRLIYECEQILTEGDIDLMRNREHLKAIRRGGFTEKDIIGWFDDKRARLEKLYHSDVAGLPYKPDIDNLRSILIDVLEEHYGSLANIIKPQTSGADLILDKIEAIIRTR